MSKEIVLPKVNERIECLFFNETVPNSEPDPQLKKFKLKKGDVGIVIEVRHIDNFFNNGKGYDQIFVKWDKYPERPFPLIAGQDAWRIL